MVLKQIESGDDLDFPLPALDADHFTAVVEYGPLVFHLVWDEQHPVSQDPIDRKSKRRPGDARYRRWFTDKARSVIMPERNDVGRALRVLGCGLHLECKRPNVKHANSPRIVRSLDPIDIRDLQIAFTPTIQ